MSGFRILIVDDQRDVRRMFADGLQMLGPGMDIVELPSGEEALLVAFRKNIHLLITDIKLPGISGLDLVKRIRKNNPDLKIIMVTGLTDPGIQEQVEQIGADAFFFKPVKMGELLDTVQKCLGIGENLPAGEVKEEKSSVPENLSEVTKPLAVTKPWTRNEELIAALRTLREQLKAQAVAFLDAKGNVAAQAGEAGLLTDLPLVSRLFNTLKNSLDVSHSLSPGVPFNMLCFSGEENYLCMAPVGTSQALLVIGGQAFQASLLSPGRRIATAAGELQKFVEKTAETEPPVKETAASPEQAGEVIEINEEPKPEDLAAVEVMLSQASTKGLKTTDLDAFWGSLAENSKPSEGQEKGFLSYEEARKMGLTPE